MFARDAGIEEGNLVFEALLLPLELVALGLDGIGAAVEVAALGGDGCCASFRS